QFLHGVIALSLSRKQNRRGCVQRKVRNSAGIVYLTEPSSNEGKTLLGVFLFPFPFYLYRTRVPPVSSRRHYWVQPEQYSALLAPKLPGQLSRGASLTALTRPVASWQQGNRWVSLGGSGTLWPRSPAVSGATTSRCTTTVSVHSLCSLHVAVTLSDAV